MNTQKIDPHARDHVIDFTKGFLVITMVAYHTLNYFLAGYHTLYAYVGYVTQAFIFYSGFMCGTIYFRKFLDNKTAIYQRLIIRGLKLIVLFFILNVFIHAILQKNFNDQDMGLGLLFNNLFSVFVTGSERIGRFTILLPIGYVLVISPLLINLHRFKYLFFFSLFAGILIITLFKISLFFNLVCLVTGIAGVFSGLIYNEKFIALNTRPLRYALIALLLLFLFVFIPFYSDPRAYFAAYFLYIIVIIYNLHLLGGYLKPSGFMTKHILKFGQYSLYLYLAQIFILQILKKAFNFQLSTVTIDHLLIFVSVNILLVGLCYLTDYLRNRISLIDKIYRFVFA